jgi:hypothetical protein
VLPFFPADARHLGLNNNFNDPKGETLMQDAVLRAIDEHRGPIYSLNHPPGSGDAILDAHSLVRIKESCAEVRTSMRISPIELCRVRRGPPR